MTSFAVALPRVALREFAAVYVVLVLIVIALQSLSNHLFFLREVTYLSAPHHDLLGTCKSLVYVLSYLVSVGFLYVALVQRSTAIFVGLLAYLCACYLIDSSSQLIEGRGGFTSYQYVLMVNEAGNVKNLLSFSSQIATSFAIVGLFAAALLVLRRVVKQRLSARWLLLLPVFVATVVGAKAAVYYIGYTAYPAPIKIPILVANHHLTAETQQPRVLDAAIKSTAPKRRNIVFIIDESVSGNRLSINGYGMRTTPKLESLIADGKVSNFGVVNSVGNCSAISNLLLRIGLSATTENVQTDFVKMSSTLPTIYQFAKRAGYTTWLIDSQNRTDQGGIQNYLTYDDTKFIDNYVTHGARMQDFQRDGVALTIIEKLLAERRGENKFIVLVKDGAHWPYLWRVPGDRAGFVPVQTREYEPMVRENRNKIINTYANLMKYTVDDFLARYVEETRSDDVVTFYTSDHGQALVEDDAKDNLTHCSSFHDPSSSQAAVPLLVIDQPGPAKYSRDPNKTYTQGQIFPSLLMEMGYARGVYKRYGNTLDNGYDKDTGRWFYWSLKGDRSPYDPIANSIPAGK